MWTNQLGRKKSYYVKEFNPICEHCDKEYLGAKIKGKTKILITQLRSGSHRLICENGTCKVPKEEWKDKICKFCNEGVVETEWHYVKDCTAYEDIHNQHKDSLKVNNIKELFKGPRLLKGAILRISTTKGAAQRNLNRQIKGSYGGPLDCWSYGRH